MSRAGRSLTLFAMTEIQILKFIVELKLDFAAQTIAANFHH